LSVILNKGELMRLELITPISQGHLKKSL